MQKKPNTNHRPRAVVIVIQALWSKGVMTATGGEYFSGSLAVDIKNSGEDAEMKVFAEPTQDYNKH